MSGKEKQDMVSQYAILEETIRKEQKHHRLHTDFSINPYRKLHLIPDKPLCRSPPEVIVADGDYMDAFHKARQVPTRKYPRPQTESQEIGWWTESWAPVKRDDSRLHFNRVVTDITKQMESILRSNK